MASHSPDTLDKGKELLIGPKELHSPLGHTLSIAADFGVNSPTLKPSNHGLQHIASRLEAIATRVEAMLQKTSGIFNIFEPTQAKTPPPKAKHPAVPCPSNSQAWRKVLASRNRAHRSLFKGNSTVFQMRSNLVVSLLSDTLHKSVSRCKQYLCTLVHSFSIDEPT